MVRDGARSKIYTLMNGTVSHLSFLGPSIIFHLSVLLPRSYHHRRSQDAEEMEHVLASPDKLLPINHDDLAVFKRYEEAQPLVLTEVGAECWIIYVLPSPTNVSPDTFVGL